MLEQHEPPLGQTYMWPTAGAADVEDASERAAAAVVADVAEDGGAFGAFLVECVEYCPASSTRGTSKHLCFFFIVKR